MDYISVFRENKGEKSHNLMTWFFVGVPNTSRHNNMSQTYASDGSDGPYFQTVEPAKIGRRACFYMLCDGLEVFLPVWRERLLLYLYLCKTPCKCRKSLSNLIHIKLDVLKRCDVHIWFLFLFCHLNLLLRICEVLMLLQLGTNRYYRGRENEDSITQRFQLMTLSWRKSSRFRSVALWLCWEDILF